jgi:hypothetical protein
MDENYSLQDSALDVVLNQARDLWGSDWGLVVAPQPDNTGFKASVVLGMDVEIGVSADKDAVQAMSLCLHRATAAFQAFQDEDEETDIPEF